MDSCIHKAGQIIRFHPEIEDFPTKNLPFGVNPCEVAIIWANKAFVDLEF